MTTTEINESDEYLTVSQLAKRFPCFSEGSIRWLIFHASTNGFGKCVRRLGRKVVLNLRMFREYIEDQTQK